MYISRIDDIGGKRYRVYIDDEYAFMLYGSDIGRYGLSENCEIGMELYGRIISETVFRRAKQKAVAILKRSDRTEQEMRRKLSEACYTEDIIDKTIEYLYGYHYLDDRRYAEQYVRYRREMKSRMELIWNLRQKGVDSEIIDEVMNGTSPDDCCIDGNGEAPELVAVKKCIRKKLPGEMKLTKDKKDKLWQYLFRRGFSAEIIKRGFDELNIEIEDVIYNL